MSQQELKRVEVIALRRSGQITQSEAARRLGMSVRQVRRLEAKVRCGARRACVRRVAGGPAIIGWRRRRWPKVGRLIRATIGISGRPLAAEYLAGATWDSAVQGNGTPDHDHGQVVAPASAAPRPAIYALRERRGRFGELIQIDGGAHAWFEARGPHCCLLVFIDDATSRLTQLHFVPQECTLGYMQTLYGHIQHHGLPMELYSDRHGIFRVNKGEARDDALRFGRALAALGMESICANSPQAKGRVERANGVLQDRLVKALRLAGIDTIAAGNAWLPCFIVRHNARFAGAPSTTQAPMSHAQPRRSPAPRILAKHYPRKLSNTLTCQFHSTLLQIHPPLPAVRPARRRRTVLEHFDHSCEVLWRTCPCPTPRYKNRAAPAGTGAQGSQPSLAARRRYHAAPKPSVENHPDRKTKPGVHCKTMNSDPEPDISTLPGTGHFYFALTPAVVRTSRISPTDAASGVEGMQRFQSDRLPRPPFSRGLSLSRASYDPSQTATGPFGNNAVWGRSNGHIGRESLCNVW